MSAALRDEHALAGCAACSMPTNGSLRFLLDLSQRFSARGFSARRFMLRMTRAEIGSFLGLTLETGQVACSRASEARPAQGDRRDIELLDMDALASLAHSANDALIAGPGNCRGEPAGPTTACRRARLPALCGPPVQLVARVGLAQERRFRHPARAATAARSSRSLSAEHTQVRFDFLQRRRDTRAGFIALVTTSVNSRRCRMGANAGCWRCDDWWRCTPITQRLQEAHGNRPDVGIVLDDQHRLVAGDRRQFCVMMGRDAAIFPSATGRNRLMVVSHAHFAVRRDVTGALFGKTITMLRPSPLPLPTALVV